MLKFIINLENNIKREVPIKEGLVIGRSKGNIVIPDPQISSTHAIIKSNNEGHFYLKDMSSTNGILVGGERVQEAFLIPGVKIRLGNTILSVEEVKIGEKSSKEKEVTSFESYIDKLDFIDNEQKTAISAFPAPIEIRFVRGLLNKTVWLLYWGPITIGTKPGSYSIVDDALEANLDIFEISQTTNESSMFLKNLGKTNLKVNGAPLSQNGLVESGDIIEFANTAFEIKL